jgi:SPP1 gp7 family putative phage head morphogenesis protein
VTPVERRQAHAPFSRARRAEVGYGRTLRGIADQISRLIHGFDFEDDGATDLLRRVLNSYSLTLRPWAEAVGRRMIEDVAARDARVWFEIGREMGRNLRHEIAFAPTGAAMRAALADQVHLITSLPLESAERVHRITREALFTGRRAADIADEIFATCNIVRHRANTIARTEVARTSTELTSARAQYIGATHFQWLTANDADVRPLHRKLHGKVFEFNNPPVIGDKQERGLPGTIYNCRCTILPIVPSQFLVAA